jgi:hypothetical protein
MLILTPESNRWPEFMDRLGDALFAGLAENDRRTSLCEHDHRYVTKIMTDMGDIDIPASIAYFRKHGGYCDCEIGFNLNPLLDDDDDFEVIDRPLSKH